MRYSEPPSQREPAEIPVSVPCIVLNVHADGTVMATVDGHPVDPLSSGAAWRRSDFPTLVDLATHGRVLPARVEVREADGQCFTDFVPAIARGTKATATPESATGKTDEVGEPSSAPSASLRAPIEIHVDGGFVPGEDIAIAIVSSHTDASSEGGVRALLDPIVLPMSTMEVVLVGRVSGTAIFKKLS